MKVIDVIENIIDSVEDLGYDIETSYGIQDHEPELVIIDNWNADRNIRGNTTLVSDFTSSDGTVSGENHSFYYTMTIDLEIRSENELNGMEISREIKEYFRQFESNPRGFDPDTVLFKVGKFGRKDPLFEPSSLALYKAIGQIELEFVDRETYTDRYETIEEIESNYDIQ